MNTPSIFEKLRRVFFGQEHDSGEKDSKLTVLEKRLDYVFSDWRLLRRALCHSSHVNENPHLEPQSNERLEFLGDAVLDLIIGHILMVRYPDIREGDLSRLRASLVNDQNLAGLARSLDLGSHLFLGRGETLTQGWDKDSILADGLEAVLGAVYLDGGFASAFTVAESLFSGDISRPPSLVPSMDYKTFLQERCQTLWKSPPTYEVVEETGPEHDKTFVVRAHLPEETFKAQGTGKNKKSAEQDAARKALCLLDEEAGNDPGKG